MPTLSCAPPLHPSPVSCVLRLGLELVVGFPHMNIGVRGKWSCGHVISWAVTTVHWLNTDRSIFPV